MSTEPLGGRFVLAARPRRPDAPQRPPSVRFLGRDLSEAALCTPPPPSFGASDMQDARLESFERGRMAGLAEADASLLAERTRALGAIAGLMAQADARASDVADRAAGLLAASLLGALRAAMPDLVARSALGEAGAMLAAVLPGLSREPRVRVEVPAAIASGVAEALALVPGVQGRVDVRPAPAMEAGGVLVTWSAGEASRRPAQVWAEIMQMIAPLLGAEPMEEVTDD